MKAAALGYWTPEQRRIDWGQAGALLLALIGHIALFVLLSSSLLSPPEPMMPQEAPISVSLVEDVGLVATAPKSVVPPAESRAPDAGPPEDAAPPTPQEAAPAPVPPAPQPAPAPAPKAADKSRPALKRPVPETPEKADKTPPKRTAAPTTAAASRKDSTGTDASATKPRPRGSRLGDDFRKGLAADPSKSNSLTPPAARIDARALASIQDAITRQIQPCADRQVNPGPGATRIITKLNLRLKPDGFLIGTPTVVDQTGLDDENSRYARRVIDLGIAAFKGCSPLRLPPEYYETSNGGWNNINYSWQLR